MRCERFSVSRSVFVYRNLSSPARPPCAAEGDTTCTPSLATVPVAMQANQRVRKSKYFSNQNDQRGENLAPSMQNPGISVSRSANSAAGSAPLPIKPRSHASRGTGVGFQEPLPRSLPSRQGNLGPPSFQAMPAELFFAAERQQQAEENTFSRSLPPPPSPLRPEAYFSFPPVTGALAAPARTLLIKRSFDDFSEERRGVWPNAGAFAAPSSTEFGRPTRPGVRPDVPPWPAPSDNPFSTRPESDARAAEGARNEVSRPTRPWNEPQSSYFPGNRPPQEGGSFYPQTLRPQASRQQMMQAAAGQNTNSAGLPSFNDRGRFGFGNQQPASQFEGSFISSSGQNQGLSNSAAQTLNLNEPPTGPRAQYSGSSKRGNPRSGDFSNTSDIAFRPAFGNLPATPPDGAPQAQAPTYATASRRADRAPKSRKGAPDYSKIGRELVKILRHDKSSDLNRDPSGGWVKIDNIIKISNNRKLIFSRDDLDQVITASGGRLEISTDNLSIRTRQGHSVPIKMDSGNLQPPTTLYHGTSESALEGEHGINAVGIHSADRTHVHLTSDLATAWKNAKRHQKKGEGKAVILEISTAAMYDEGQDFFKTDDFNWITTDVAAGHFKIKEEADKQGQ